jgi:magnesium chelatase subunit I
LKIDSLRTEISLFEAARAHAAADGRKKVTFEDLRAVALLTLRLRRSGFMTDYLSSQQTEEDEINKAITN